MKKILRKLMFGLALVASAAMGSCSDDPDAIDETPDLGQALMPLNFKAAVMSSGNEVRLAWDTRKGVASYEVVIYTDEELTNEVKTVSEIAPKDVPVTLTLDAEQEYWATVQAFNENADDLPSRLAVAGPIPTYAIMSPLNPEVTAREATSISMKWTQDDFVSHLLATPITGEGLEPVQHDLSADEIAAGEATVAGLAPSTLYSVSLFYNSASRGGQDVYTRPDASTTTVISTSEALMQAFADGGNYLLSYSDVAYAVPEFGEGQTNPATTLAVDLKIIGETSLDGKKPVIEGLGIGLNPGVKSIHLEDLVLDPVGKASSLLEVKDAIEMTSVMVKNCDVTGYRNMIYENKGGSKISAITFDGLYAANMGNAGGDFIDFRTASNHGSLTVCNSTFFNGARSFVRIDANENFESVTFANNTVGSFALIDKGVLYVRGTIGSYVVKNNLFLNEDTEKARFIANHSASQMPSEIASNYFFNCAETFFTATITDGAAVTLETALQNGGKVLDADPCENSARGKFYVINDEIAEKQIGDPRWWNAVAPVIPEQAELNAISDACVWNLADTEAFPPQEITRNKILSNLQFLVNDETTPMSVTENGTIAFSVASKVSKDGVPTNNALAFLVNTPGTVLLTPANAAYNTHMEVIVNGERFAIPANGEQSKIGLADITEETMIYVCSCSAVELTALEWSLEVVSGGEPQPLETPVFTSENLNADAGSDSSIVVEWGAVANAEAYEVTFNGKTQSVAEPKFTVSAKSLAAGLYDLTVVAKAKEGSLNYVDSEVATITIEINGVLETVSGEYVWNIADAVAFPAMSITSTKVYGNLQFIVTNPEKGMTIEHSVGDDGTPTDRLKFNGKSTITDFVPTNRGIGLRVGGNGTLTVKAISSSSGDATREIGVSANGKEYLREACPTSSTDGESKSIVFDDLAGETMIYLYCYNSINIYELSWKPADNTVPATKDYTMTLTVDAGVLSSNISGLPSKYGDATWTATDDSGANTLNFSGNVYYSTDSAKNIVWYFNKNNAKDGKSGTYVQCSELGKIRKITITMNTGKTYRSQDLTLTYDSADATKVLATTEDAGEKSDTFTYDFEAAGIETGYFNILHTNPEQNVEVGAVIIEYTK